MSNTSLRVALIGYGVSGAVFHAPLIASTSGLDLAVIVTKDSARHASATKAYPHACVVPDAESLWRRGGFDLVVVATPNRSHTVLVEQAIGAGVAVLVDKPLAVSSVDGERIVALARSKGVPLSVFQNRRWDSDFRTLCMVLSEGHLGATLRLESRFEMYRPMSPAAWRESMDPKDGGGVLFDLGSHLIDQAMVLFGHPKTVYCEMHRRRPRAVVDDDAFVSLSFRGDVTCHLSMSKSSRATGPRFRVVGTNAAFEINGTDPQWLALQRGELPGGPSWGRHSSQGVLTSGDGITPQHRKIRPLAGAYQRFYQRLRDALLGQGSIPVDPHDAVEVLRVIEAARESAHLARTVALEEPATETGGGVLAD